MAKAKAPARPLRGPAALKTLRGAAAKKALEDRVIDQTMAAVAKTIMSQDTVRKGFAAGLGPGAGAMAASSWSNMGGTTSRLIAQVTQNLAASFGRAPEELELALARQGLTWGPPFPPGRPLDPYFGYKRPPRLRDYQVGENVQLTPRWGRISFQTLKALWDAYDVAQICTTHLINDVRSLDYHFEAARGVRDDVADDIRQAYVFFDSPDKRMTFRPWLAKYLMDVIRYDAGALNVRRTEAGDAYALEVLSGSTLIPQIDYFGRIATDEDPNDPELSPAGLFEGKVTPAFLQVVMGMPWVWLTFDDVIYQPLNPLPESQYGHAPLEMVLLTSNTDLRFQWHFLNYFTEGSIPAGLMQAPEGLTDPGQIQEWQAIWDALMVGDQEMLRKIRWVPFGTEYTPVGPAAEKQFNSEFPLYLMRRTCAAHGVTPADLGFTETVNKATSEVQVDVQFRVGTLPLVRHVEDVITIFCQEDLGLRVRLRFDTGREIEDRLATAQAEKIYIDSGVISPDEPRTRLGYPIDPNQPTPRFINNTRSGPIPLLALESLAGEIDPETYGPSKGAKHINHPFFEVPGVAPVIGSTDYKNAQNSTAAMQANMVARGAGVQEPYGDDETTSPRSPSMKKPPAAAARASDIVLPTPKPARVKGQASKAVYIAAGIAMVAKDSGRTLMLQRARDDMKKKAAGKWEFPGGLLEPGEAPWDAAKREWEEETGNKLPNKGRVVATWENGGDSEQGLYQLFIYLVKFEADVNLNPDREAMEVIDADHPNARQTEVMAWWDPDLAETAGKAIRKDLRNFDWDLIRAAAEEAVSTGFAKDEGGGITSGITAATGMHGVDLRSREDDEDDDAKKETIEVQLRQWREMARNRLRKGQPPRRFVSADLPPELVDEIWDELQKATTRQDVDRIFLSKAHPRPEPGEPEQGLRAALANAIAGDVQRHAIRAAYTAIHDDAAKATLHKPSQPRARARHEALSVLLQAELAVEQVAQALLTAWAWAGTEGAAAALQALGKAGTAELAEVGDYRDLTQRANPIARGMANALLYEIADTIAFTAWEGRDEDQIHQAVGQAVKARAALDAAIQLRRAHHVSRMDTYRTAGVQRLAWTGGACARCQRNAAASPIGINDEWPDGSPPVHPECGCGVVPA